MSRIIHPADVHHRENWFNWISANCGAYDLLVLAGDLQNAFASVSMHQQAKLITSWLISLPTPTCLVSGNHGFWTSRGSTDVYAEGGWLKLLRGRGNIVGVPGDLITFQGLRIACNGWLQVPDLSGPTDILVTHAPIAGSATAAGVDGGPDVGDPELWPAIADDPPRLILSGHVHDPREKSCVWPPIDPSTTILVPGCDETSDVPLHWIIDTTRSTAIHSSGQEVSW